MHVLGVTQGSRGLGRRSAGAEPAKAARIRSPWRPVGVILAAVLALVLLDAGAAVAAVGAASAPAQSHGWAGPFLGQAAAANGPDIWGKDNPSDTGLEPNGNTSVFGSPDIRLRKSNADGPHESAVNDVDNFVFITVRNRGDEPVTKAEIHLYSTRFGANAVWQSGWQHIGSTFAVNVPPHSDQVVGPIIWKPTQSGHYCLLVRMVPLPPVDQIVGETTNTKQNTVDHNNIIWKNVDVFDLGNKPHQVPVQIVNADATAGKYNVKFREPRGQLADSLVKHARIVVDLKSLTAQLRRGKVAVRGLRRIRGSRYRITDLGKAAVTGIVLKSKAKVSIDMSFNATKAERGKHYSLDVTQERVVGKRARDDGGVRFDITT